jgi:hypothetical protein
MFKRYLNYELQNIENEVGNWFSLAEFVGETLYSGNYVNFILSPEQNLSFVNMFLIILIVQKDSLSYNWK